jgi:hypothetical protein
MGPFPRFHGRAWRRLQSGRSLVPPRHPELRYITKMPKVSRKYHSMIGMNHGAAHGAARIEGET